MFDLVNKNDLLLDPTEDQRRISLYHLSRFLWNVHGVQTYGDIDSLSSEEISRRLNAPMPSDTFREHFPGQGLPNQSFNNLLNFALNGMVFCKFREMLCKIIPECPKEDIRSDARTPAGGKRKQVRPFKLEFNKENLLYYK